MPVSKTRKNTVELVDKVAELLQIDPSLVFLDAVPVSAAKSSEDLILHANKRIGIGIDFFSEDKLAKRLRVQRARRKNTVRIWTGNMTEAEKKRIRSMKAETKALCVAEKTKIAMSDRHPLGEDGQIAFEDRRRSKRGAKSDRRRIAKNEAKAASKVPK